MSELEFEKACRGPNNSLYQEYAWGTTNIGSPPTGYTVNNQAMPGENLTGLVTNAGNAVWDETWTIYPTRTAYLQPVQPITRARKPGLPITA